MDHVLFTCDQRNFTECLALARTHRAGLEVQAFTHPNVLDGNWREILDACKAQLVGFDGALACHGAFYDLASGSPDRLVRGVARQRYLHNLDIADELGARTIVFHANFLPQVGSTIYRTTWSETQAEFWGDLVKRAEELGITITLENMWEPEPMLIGGVIDCVGSAQLRACVDVGHVHLYSKVPFRTWLHALNSRLVYVHMNNNPGTADVHGALDEGVIDYDEILPALRSLEPTPTFALEISTVNAIKKSLRYLDLP